MTDRVEVTVILPVRNAAATLAEQLHALSKQTYCGTVEVLVSDNGSTDETQAVFDANANLLRQFHRVAIVDAARRRGVAGARNAAAEVATGDLLLFCDADDRAAPTWMEELVAALRKVDVVGGHLELDLLNTRSVRLWRTDPTMTRLPRALGFLPYAVGANLGVRTLVYRALSGCDERYQGHEDVEFCWRAQLAGYTIAYAPDAIVHYRLRSTLRGLMAQRYRSGQTYAQLFADYRHLGIPPGQWRDEAEVWGRLLLTVPTLAWPGRAGRWVFAAAWHCGRSLGSLSHRAFCPG
ncbi:glycosyltransferase [Nocardia salmonicida]|uniref:glycosyltransferase n=1 Tax=Nocardia salmonicida TaxID=53431 RepID=UPI0033C6FA92